MMTKVIAVSTYYASGRTLSPSPQPRGSTFTHHTRKWAQHHVRSREREQPLPLSLLLVSLGAHIFLSLHGNPGSVIAGQRTFHARNLRQRGQKPALLVPAVQAHLLSLEPGM